MVKNQIFVERAKRAFTPNYRPAPIVLERGDGAYLFDVEGNRFLDMVSGIAVSALGHNHPKLVEALRAQVGKVLHTSNLYLNRPSVELAEALTQHCFADRVYFCNSGAEANEASIKLARRYHWDRDDKARVEIVTFDRSFHGRTLAALAATAQPKYQQGFGPMPEGFRYVPYGDMEALEKVVSDKTAAIMIEPIQGEGGVRVPPAGYLAKVRALADAHGALLIFDEVQVGVGRTGKMFCHQREGVTPDIMSLAKGIGGGLPLGAMVTTEAVGASLEYGTHATTYGGNPVACTAGKVVFDVLAEPGFFEGMSDVSEQLFSGLTALGEKYDVFEEVRGAGLLIGAQLKEGLSFDAKTIVAACRENLVLVHIAGLQVLRLAPPLILSSQEVDRALEAIDAALEAATHTPS